MPGRFGMFYLYLELKMTFGSIWFNVLVVWHLLVLQVLLFLNSLSSSICHHTNLALALSFAANLFLPPFRCLSVCEQAGPPDVLANNIYQQSVWRFQRGQDYKNNNRRTTWVVYAGDYQYSKHQNTSIWTCREVINRLFVRYLKCPEICITQTIFC